MTGLFQQMKGEHKFVSVCDTCEILRFSYATRTINSCLQTLAYASTEITPMWCNPHRIFRPIILTSVSKITPSYEHLKK